MPDPAVICYTSAQPITLPNPTLQDKTYGIGDLPASTLQLYAAAYDTGAPSATFTYLWSILDKPSGSTASLASATTQNPQLVNINAQWGNILLLCVATSSSGRVSESRTLYAPESAFMHVRVQSSYLSLQKPAKWERNWHPWVRALAQQIEYTFGRIFTQTIAEHGDVSIATGPKLDQLVGGGLASYDGGTLHRHTGVQIQPASNTFVGVVQTESAPEDSFNPVVINEERVVFCARVVGETTFYAFFWLPDSLLLHDVHILMQDGGAGTGSNTFVLYRGSAADFDAGTATMLSGSTMTGSPGTPHGNLQLSWTPGTPVSLDGGQWLAVVQQAHKSDAGDKVNVTVTCHRKV